MQTKIQKIATKMEQESKIWTKFQRTIHFLRMRMKCYNNYILASRKSLLELLHVSLTFSESIYLTELLHASPNNDLPILHFTERFSTNQLPLLHSQILSNCPFLHELQNFNLFSIPCWLFSR